MSNKKMDCCLEALDEFFDDFMPEYILQMCYSAVETISRVSNLTTSTKSDIHFGLNISEELLTIKYAATVELIIHDELLKKSIPIPIVTIPLPLCKNEKVAKNALEKIAHILHDLINRDEECGTCGDLEVHDRGKKSSPKRGNKLWN